MGNRPAAQHREAGRSAARVLPGVRLHVDDLGAGDRSRGAAAQVGRRAMDEDRRRRVEEEWTTRLATQDPWAINARRGAGATVRNARVSIPLYCLLPNGRDK